MSLSSILRVKDVRQRFSAEFQKPRLAGSRQLLAPPLTKNYSLVGTAFDYLLRFHLKRLNPHARTQTWIAAKGLASLGDMRRLHKTATSLMIEATRNYRAYLKNGKIDDDLIRSAIFLAKMDSVYRAGFFHRVFLPNRAGAEFRRTFLDADPQDVKDLGQLIALLPSALFRASKLCVLNPTFGKASDLVGSADADVIIDGMLVEVKTTKKHELQRDYFNQLVGYYCLHRIGHIKGTPRGYKIQRLGVYFSRFGYLWSIEVKDAINRGGFASFLRWFRERLNQEAYW